MNTPSHFLMTAALRKKLVKFDIPKAPFYLGSVAPDIPLYLLSISGWVWCKYILGWGGAQTGKYLFDDLFFYNFWWIVSHNALHAPFLLLIGSLISYILTKMRFAAGRWASIFFAACWIHCVVDIFTHHSDGPLIFFPFEWTVRFHSAVSYWEAGFFAKQFLISEILFDIVLIFYLLQRKKV